jgi:hypothetical protein
MSEDERTVTCKGSDNYEDWKLSISSVLLSKDILDLVKTSRPTTEAKDKRDVCYNPVSHCHGVSRGYSSSVVPFVIRLQ